MKKHSRKLRYFILVYGALVLLAAVGFWVVLPAQITLVGRDLEDVQQYILALKIQAQKMEVQKTLASGEEVLEVYHDEPKYFQVTNTCNWHFAGPCVEIMMGPGAAYPVANIYYERQGPFPERIRTGQVFPMLALIKGKDGSLWYKIDLSRYKLTFPDRVHSDWFVPAQHFVAVDFAPIDPASDATKRIEVILHEQMLYAYEGDTLFMKTSVSTGREVAGLGSNSGSFHVYKKVPMAIMEGPLPSMVSLITPTNIPDFEYTLFVPFAMAYNPDITGIAFIHEAYWHNGFGAERSHGCVNVNPTDALTLYNWTPDPSQIKIPVTVLP